MYRVEPKDDSPPQIGALLHRPPAHAAWLMPLAVARWPARASAPSSASQAADTKFQTHQRLHSNCVIKDTWKDHLSQRSMALQVS